MKDNRWWAITNTNSDCVMADTVRETRAKAMKACCDNRYRYRSDPKEWRPEWLEWKSRGCKAVRVIVRRET